MMGPGTAAEPECLEQGVEDATAATDVADTEQGIRTEKRA